MFWEWGYRTVLFYFFDIQVITIETPYPVKEEEENAMHNTVVIFSSNDNFTLKQVFVNSSKSLLVLKI